MGRLSEDSVINIKNKSFTVTAEIVVGDEPSNGTIIAQGGPFGGWTLYTKEAPRASSTTCSGSSVRTQATEPIPAGTHQVRMEFAYDGGGLAKGGESRSTTTGTRSQQVGSRPPNRSSSPPTRPPTSATTPARRSSS